MLDISRQEVWGKPGQWRYGHGPDKPSVDWVCEAEPLYGYSGPCEGLLEEIQALHGLVDANLCEYRELAVERDQLRAELAEALEALRPFADEFPVNQGLRSEVARYSCIGISGEHLFHAAAVRAKHAATEGVK